LQKKLGLDRRKFGDFLEDMKRAHGMPPNSHDKKFAEKMAKEFKETGGH
jgi:hypothetical protein